MKYYNWEATFEYMGEHWGAMIYGRENQPGEFEFLQVLRERMSHRNYDPSRLRLLSIRKLPY
jgi:hypothetical protein